MALAQPMNPEAILEKRQKRKELFDAVMALPDKQAKRIYARFYLGLTVKEAARVAYDGVKKVHFDGMQYRSDIGYRAMK